MRKSYTFGIPFAVHKKTGQILDITEVERGTDCGCICPGCKTELVAKQGEVKLWHFSHTTSLQGDCDGLMLAIRAKIIDLLEQQCQLAVPHVLEGYDGGTVFLDNVEESQLMFGGTADLVVTIDKLRVGVFLDLDRKVRSRLSFDQIHPSEPVAALRIDVLDLEFELGKVQRGERHCTYSECIEELITQDTASREWMYHPVLHQLNGEKLKVYHGREPAEAGPLLQRMADHAIAMRETLPTSRNALIIQRRATITCLSRLTVRGTEIAQTDELPLFLRYFRLHCFENCETVSVERLTTLSEMIATTDEGQRLTEEERDYLNELVRIGFYNKRLCEAFVTESDEQQPGKGYSGELFPPDEKLL
jgi:hypothetical protein